MGHLVNEGLGHEGVRRILDRAPRINGHRQPADEKFDVEVRNFVDDPVPVRRDREIDKSPQARDVDAIFYPLRIYIFYNGTGNHLLRPRDQLARAVEAGLNPLARGCTEYRSPLMSSSLVQTTFTGFPLTLDARTA